MPYDVDLLSLIASLCKELRCQLSPIWVKGHQDTLNLYECLHFAARLNINADFLVNRYRLLRSRLKSQSTTSHEPSRQCSIILNNVRLTSQFDQCIRFNVNGYHLRCYLQERNGLSDSVWNEVDFKVLGSHFA